MSNSNKQRRTRSWIVALVFVSFISAIYSSLWFVLVTTMQEQAVTWIKKQSDHGLSVRYKQLVASGFPFAVHLEVKNPTLSVSDTFPPFEWRGENLRVTTQIWDRNRFKIEISGQQVLTLWKAKEIRKFTGDLKQVLGQFVFSAGEIKKVSIAFRGVQLINNVSTYSAIRIPRADLFLQRLERTQRDHQAASWRLSASTENLTLPLLKNSPLSSKLSLILEASLFGNIDKSHLIKSLEKWRDNGGVAEIEKLKIVHGPLKIHTEGTIALDDKMQPIGALTAHLEGFYETIDALKKLGIVKASSAITAKVLVGVLSRTPVAGGPPVLNLAITVQDQNLYIGPVRLLRLPEVSWR